MFYLKKILRPYQTKSERVGVRVLPHMGVLPHPILLGYVLFVMNYKYEEVL